MAIPPSVTAFIADQRDVLDQLERFLGSPEYHRLLAVIAPMVDAPPEPWLSEWMIERTDGMNARPIDVVRQPGGLERVEQHLKWLSTFMID